MTERKEFLVIERIAKNGKREKQEIFVGLCKPEDWKSKLGAKPEAGEEYKVTQVFLSSENYLGFVSYELDSSLWFHWNYRTKSSSGFNLTDRTRSALQTFLDNSTAKDTERS
jgi:hypothetical protein